MRGSRLEIGPKSDSRRDRSLSEGNLSRWFFGKAENFTEHSLENKDEDARQRTMAVRMPYSRWEADWGRAFVSAISPLGADEGLAAFRARPR